AIRAPLAAGAPKAPLLMDYLAMGLYVLLIGVVLAKFIWGFRKPWQLEEKPNLKCRPYVFLSFCHRGADHITFLSLLKSTIDCLVLTHDRRRILHFKVTPHPTAEWVVQQLREAFPSAQLPRYLLRDRDAIFGHEFQEQVRGLGICEVCRHRVCPGCPIAPHQCFRSS